MQCEARIIFALYLIAFCSGEDFGEPVNVAFKKVCNQSSTYRWYRQTFPAENAVDDKSDTCINTDYENAPWWSVDLGKVLPVLNITIYLRPSYFARIENSRILLDGQLCATIGEGLRENPINIQCINTMYGHTFMIIKQGRDFLNFCDFQVWVPQFISVCNAGKYGSDCKLNCSQYCDGGPDFSVCHSDTGVCYGCPAGRFGRMCEKNCESMKCFKNKCHQETGECMFCSGNYTPPACTDCKDTYYGLNCSKNCHWYKNCFGSKTCNKTSGYCDSCPPGKSGGYCNDDCSKGQYGVDCAVICGHCYNNAACNKITGHCTHCKKGYIMPFCKDGHTECRNNTYGTNCEKTCGQCKGGQPCNITTGKCIQGCDPGWTGDKCNEECNGGYYGVDCVEECGHCHSNASCNKTNGHCIKCRKGYTMPLLCPTGKYGHNCKQSCGRCKGGQSCNATNGKCINGCDAGWTNITCDQACSDGRYGRDCTEFCGNCANKADCNKESGQCQSCSTGFQPPLCKAEAVVEEAGSVSPFLVGAVAAIVVVIVIIIIIIIIVKKKQKRSSESQYCNVSYSPTHTRDLNSTRPKAKVQPQRRESPSGLHYNNTGVIYENVPGLTDGHQCQTTKEQTKTYETSENAVTHSGAVKPPRKKKTGQEIVVMGDNSVQQKSNERVSQTRVVTKVKEEMTQDLDNLDEVIDEYDDVDNDDLVYSNEASNLNFKPADVPLITLQKYLFDHLKGQQLEDEFSKLPPKMIHDHECGMREENHFKNRFNSILPYDNTRVILDTLENDSSSDYINANYIQGYKDRFYIAAQGPKNNTVDDFWQMVWQKRVEHIVMLTNVMENTKPKCHEYWPAEGVQHTYGQIEVEGLDEHRRAHCVIRTFEIKNVVSPPKRTVKQYHYISWFDHDVPRAVDLVDFWRFVKSQACNISSPLLVHCSAGVGRTGTYLALDIIMDQAQHEKEVNIYDTVRRMRDDRCNMVQNKKQYRFLHEAILEAYTSTNTRFQSSTFDLIFPHPIRFNLPNDRIDNEYEILKKMQESFPRPAYTVATREENRLKNRNSKVLPDDKHLVYLSPYVIGRTQYINAVYMSFDVALYLNNSEALIDTFLDARGCILTQRPLADTVMDIWRLIDGCGIALVVSIMTLDEDKEEACRYWPQQDGETFITGIYTVTLKSKEQVGSSLSCYSLELQNQEKTRDVRVLRYTDWTNEIPDNIPELLQVIETLQSNTSVRGRNPVLVQCNDGVSKSGLFCALWEIITRMVHNNEIDVYLTVRKVQNVRLQAVNTLAQYRFCYEIAQKYRDAASVYANT